MAQVVQVDDRESGVIGMTSHPCVLRRRRLAQEEANRVGPIGDRFALLGEPIPHGPFHEQGRIEHDRDVAASQVGDDPAPGGLAHGQVGDVSQPRAIPGTKEPRHLLDAEARGIGDPAWFAEEVQEVDALRSSIRRIPHLIRSSDCAVVTIGPVLRGHLREAMR